MKVLALAIKILATVSLLLAFMAFGSDLLPVEGVNFGGHESSDGNHQFYKIVPIDGINPIPIGVAFLFVGIILFAISLLVKKHLEK